MNFNNSTYFPIQPVRNLISNKLTYRPTVFRSMVTFLTSLYQYYDKQSSVIYIFTSKGKWNSQKIRSKNSVGYDNRFYAIINFATLLQAKPFQFMLGTGMAIEVIVKERVSVML